MKHFAVLCLLSVQLFSQQDNPKQMSSDFRVAGRRAIKAINTASLSPRDMSASTAARESVDEADNHRVNQADKFGVELLYGYFFAVIMADVPPVAERVARRESCKAEAEKDFEDGEISKEPKCKADSHGGNN